VTCNDLQSGLRAAYAEGRPRRIGKAARVKVTWLVAANDSYFSPTCRVNCRCVSLGAVQADFARCRPMAVRDTGCRNRRWCKKLAGPELDRALKPRPATPVSKRMTLYFLVKYLHVLGRDRHARHRHRYSVLMLRGIGSRDVAFIARTAGDGGDRDMVLRDGGAAAAGSGGVLMWLSATAVERALADDLARLYAVAGMFRVPVINSCRSKCAISPEGGHAQSRSCRRAILHLSTAGSVRHSRLRLCHGYLWLMIAKPY